MEHSGVHETVRARCPENHALPGFIYAHNRIFASTVPGFEVPLIFATKRSRHSYLVQELQVIV